MEETYSIVLKAKQENQECTNGDYQSTTKVRPLGSILVIDL